MIRNYALAAVILVGVIILGGFISLIVFLFQRVSPVFALLVGFGLYVGFWIWFYWQTGRAVEDDSITRINLNEIIEEDERDHPDEPRGAWTVTLAPGSPMERDLYILRDQHPVHWVIYFNVEDYPDQWVMRRCVEIDDHKFGDSDFEVCPSLEDARACIPPGLARYPRGKGDDAHVVESWR